MGILGLACNMARLIRFLYGLGRQIARAWHVTLGLRSFFRLARDLALSRLIPYVRFPSINHARCIRVTGGVKISYRLNRGDIQSIREVWLEEAYKLPVNMRPKIVVDLGANIGLTSLCLARRYGCDEIIAIQPDMEHTRVTRQNSRS